MTYYQELIQDFNSGARKFLANFLLSVTFGTLFQSSLITVILITFSSSPSSVLNYVNSRSTVQPYLCSV